MPKILLLISWFLLIFLVKNSKAHICIHDRLRPLTVDVEQPFTGLADIVYDFFPLTFLSDLRYLTNDDPTRICISEGQRFKIGDPVATTVVCTAEISENCWATCLSDDIASEKVRNLITDIVLPDVLKWLNEVCGVSAPSPNLPLTQVFEVRLAEESPGQPANLRLSTTQRCGALGGVVVPPEYAGWCANCALLLLFSGHNH